MLTFDSLKKRRLGIYHSVPVPPPLLEALDMVHGVREQQAARGMVGLQPGPEVVWPYPTHDDYADAAGAEEKDIARGMWGTIIET